MIFILIIIIFLFIFIKSTKSFLSLVKIIKIEFSELSNFSLNLSKLKFISFESYLLINSKEVIFFLNKYLKKISPGMINGYYSKY